MIAKSANPTSVRCPACGQPLNPPDAARCPLCHQPLTVMDSRPTGEDVTPYARSRERGRGKLSEMIRWVTLASSQRLKHLAMIRASDASRRFALVSCLWFALGLAVVQGSRTGWRTVLVAADSASVIKPTGQGWIKAAVWRSGGSELWWNPAQAMIGAAAGGVAGLLILGIWRALLTAGVRIAHGGEHRQEQRMTAALHYSLAWGGPALAAALLCVIRIPVIIGETAHWSWTPPDMGILMFCGILAAVSATGWWIWLVRLGATAPQVCRGKVTAFFLIGAPLLTAGAGAAWWFAWEWGGPKLFEAMNLQF